MAAGQRRRGRRAPSLGGSSSALAVLVVSIVVVLLCGVLVAAKTVRWLTHAPASTVRPPRSTTTTRPLVPLPAGVQTSNADFTLKGENVASSQDMVAFFNSKYKAVHPATSSIEDLSVWYVQAGAEFGVRGDVLFVQSVLETGWFGFPEGGQVRPEDHNFAGICAFDTVDRTKCRTPTDREGIRLQAALVREVTTKGYRHKLPYKVHWKYPTGCCATTNALSGKWASSTGYGRNLNLLYADLLRTAGYSSAPVG